MTTRATRMPVVALGDIADCESFVCTVMARKLMKVGPGEWDDLVAEGLAILCHLWRRYDPSRDKPSTKPGHVCKSERCCKPSFAGYASHLLPPKMLDAWHSLHPEHLLRTQPDGKRRYVYLDAAVSIEEGASGVELREDFNHLADMPGVRAVGEFIPLRERGRE